VTVAASCVAAACDTSSASADVRSPTRPDSAEQVMFGVRSALTSAGIKRGELAADSGAAFEAGTRYELHGVRVTFVTTLGSPLATLSAREATYVLADAALEAYGQVVVVSDTSGRRLESAHVRWTAARNELSSDSAFVATAGTRRLTGTGFVSDPGLFTVRCLQDCSGSLGR
jgi:hypothetical protein